jgi:hypothetical protein
MVSDWILSGVFYFDDPIMRICSQRAYSQSEISMLIPMSNQTCFYRKSHPEKNKRERGLMAPFVVLS